MSDTEDEEPGYECANCLSLTTEFGDCSVCGADPHKGEGYRIECKECGAIEHGDRGQNVQFDMRYHRDHSCQGAEFEVTALE